MTGFGKSAAEMEGKKITIELKSLNSKQFDVNFRLPPRYREKEAEIRMLISGRLERGKVEMNINLDDSGAMQNYQFNHELARQYYQEIMQLSQELKLDPDENMIQTLVRLPDVLKAEAEELSEEEWNMLKQAILEAAEGVNQFRTQEGKALEKDLRLRVEKIRSLLEEVPPLEGKRIERLRERLQKQLEDSKLQGSVDQNRFEQEIIYYLEKLDITEEKVRLSKHCEYFLEVMQGNGSNGKKLGFVSQEMGREINTLGSKANDADMQKIVVLMKDELEKIKEQLFNIL